MKKTLKALKLFLSLIILCSLVTSCKKNKSKGEEALITEISTLSITPVSPTKAILKGSFLKKGTPQILEYGFVYSNAENFEGTTGIKVSLGSDPSEGEFTTTLENLQLNSNVLYVRAYFRDEKSTIFGQIIKGTLPVVTTSGISPQSGKSGDLIKISGNFFSPTLASVKVTIGDIDAKVISVSDQEITAEIPSGINAVHNSPVVVSASVGSSTLSVSTGFRIKANIKDFSPKYGGVISALTFTGDNLPAEYNADQNASIYFSDVLAIRSYDKTFKCYVPYNTGLKSKISVVLSGEKTELPGEFSLSLPTNASYDPEISLPGTMLYVSSESLPELNFVDEGRPMIKIGANPYRIMSFASKGTYFYPIPDNITPGEYSVMIKVGGHETELLKKLKIVAPAITGFSPVKAGPGKELTITGTFDPNNRYSVYFDNATEFATTISSSSLKVKIPASVEAGKIKIKIELPSRNLLTADGYFEMLGPSIESFSPITAKAGELITIKGEGFLPTYYNMVSFGYTGATPVSITENTITVAVPENLPIGEPVKIKLITGGQSAISTGVFTKKN